MKLKRERTAAQSEWSTSSRPMPQTLQSPLSDTGADASNLTGFAKALVDGTAAVVVVEADVAEKENAGVLEAGAASDEAAVLPNANDGVEEDPLTPNEKDGVDDDADDEEKENDGVPDD